MPQPGRQDITFRADAELIKAVDDLAKRVGVTRSELCRRALEQWCAETNQLINLGSSSFGMAFVKFARLWMAEGNDREGWSKMIKLLESQREERKHKNQLSLGVQFTDK